MTLGVSTAGFWHFASLEESLRAIADAGVTGVEFFPYPPHLESATFGTYERNRVRRLLADLGLKCVSVNFTMELNLMALHTGLHDLAMSEFRKAMEIGADLGAPCLVLPVGRLHSLMPAPEQLAIDFLCEEVGKLAEHGEKLGIKVGLETLPFEMLGTGRKVADLVERIGHSNLGICYDCTNTFAFEDPAQGVRDVAEHLILAHVSDCWRDRWAHTTVGVGEIDFAAFAQALSDINYTGDVVFELMDGQDPSPRLKGDIERLVAHGYSL